MPLLVRGIFMPKKPLALVLSLPLRSKDSLERWGNKGLKGEKVGKGG
jgi:hypothetical protein